MGSTPPGLLAGRYRLARRIGAGSFAETYLATDTRIERPVAVKVLRDEHLADPRPRERFAREARAVAPIQHANVVSVFDAGLDGDVAYIVMEWVDGVDLKRIIRERAPLPVAEAVALASGILAGMEAIHQAGVVHRDIKPQNILVARDGRPKLGDFGIARRLADTGLTDTGMALGTAAYMAPEQAIGAACGPAADLYAAGVVLFEMLTGRLPFPGDNPVQVMYQHVHEPPPLPSSLNPAIPAALDALVLRALAKEPERRYASAAAMAAALDGDPGAQETIAAVAAVPSSLERLGRRAAARPAWASSPAAVTRWASTAAAALLLILLAGALILASGGDPDTPALESSLALDGAARAAVSPEPSPTARQPDITPPETNPPPVDPEPTSTPAPAPAVAPAPIEQAQQEGTGSGEATGVAEAKEKPERPEKPEQEKKRERDEPDKPDKPEKPEKPRQADHSASSDNDDDDDDDDDDEDDGEAD